MRDFEDDLLPPELFFELEALRPALLFDDDLELDAFLDEDFFAPPLELDDLLLDLELLDFLAGTFPPSLLASDNPIAIACFLLVTFLPDPDFKVPRFNLCISVSTLSCDFFPYLAIFTRLPTQT